MFFIPYTLKTEHLIFSILSSCINYEIPPERQQRITSLFLFCCSNALSSENVMSNILRCCLLEETNYFTMYKESMLMYLKQRSKQFQQGEVRLS